MNDFRTIRPDLYLVYDPPLVDRIFVIVTGIVESPDWDAITLDDVTMRVRTEMKRRDIVVLHPEHIISAVMDYYTSIKEIDQITMDSPRCRDAVKKVLWPYVARMGPGRDLDAMASAITGGMIDREELSSALVTRELADNPAFTGLREVDINDMVVAVFYYLSDLGLIGE